MLTLSPAMRAVLPALLLVAACSGGEDAENISGQAPASKPTGPVPRTPVTDISPEPGNSASWMGARDGADDAKRAPYGDVLDQPVVNGSGR